MLSMVALRALEGKYMQPTDAICLVSGLWITTFGRVSFYRLLIYRRYGSFNSIFFLPTVH